MQASPCTYVDSLRALHEASAPVGALHHHVLTLSGLGFSASAGGPAASNIDSHQTDILGVYQTMSLKSGYDGRASMCQT